MKTVDVSSIRSTERNGPRHLLLAESLGYGSENVGIGMVASQFPMPALDEEDIVNEIISPLLDFSVVLGAADDTLKSS